MKIPQDNTPDVTLITKSCRDEHNETLGEIVAKDARKARIFNKYGLDYCCGGKQTVQQACATKDLDVTMVEQELRQAGETSAPASLPYNDWSLDFLADYIVNTHHHYVKTTLPDIIHYAKKAAQVHGSRHPELARVSQLLEDVKAELIDHMHNEEVLLFPYIKDLVAAGRQSSPVRVAQFGTVKNPIATMQVEHETVGTTLATIRHLTNNYTLPEGACATYTLLYGMLGQFENDLHMHVHLENNILFPKAVDLEKKLQP